MRALRLCLWAVPLLLAAGLCGQSSVPTPGEAAETVWKDFRKAYPHPLQTLAATATDKDGWRTLIISEPPPHVTVDQLRQHAPELATLTVKQHNIGYHGWVKDVVVPVKVSDRRMAELVGSLSRLLFHTAYKAHTLQLPAAPPKAPPVKLEVQVSASDLERWLITEKPDFQPVEGGAKLSLGKLCASARSTVCIADQKSLVVWWIPHKISVRQCAVQARQFALDSDLVVGAFGHGPGILVIGRQRVAPVDILPPLRVETLMLLAGVRHDSLAQSFERTHFLAGRLDFTKDWAPIYLSPELVDTEYGLLLIIADMIIKAWSNAGLTEYDGFLASPPQHWPFKAPLPVELQVSRIVYNWNTAGAVYRQKAKGLDTLALNRTGALPVRYIPGQTDQPKKLEQAEEVAYDYFARLQNSQLVQVARYAALYQVFQALSPAPGAKPIGNYWPETVFARNLTELLIAVRDADFKTVEMALERNVKLLKEAKDNPELHKGLLLASQSQFKPYSDQELKELASRLARARGGLTAKAALLPQALAALRGFAEQYARQVEQTAADWLHTPAVVVSSNKGILAGAVGGHNVDAAVVRFVANGEVEAGKPRVTKDKTGRYLIEYNPKDAERMGQLARLVGRRTQPGAILPNEKQLETEIHQILEDTKPPAVRNPADALGTPPPPKGPPKAPPPPPDEPPADALFGGSGEGPRRGSVWGWALVAEEKPNTLRKKLEQHRENLPGCILVERRPDSTFRILHDPDGSPIVAFSIEAALDVVLERNREAPANAPPIVLEGFNPEQVQGFMLSYRVQAEATNLPPGRRWYFLESGAAPQRLEVARQTTFDFKNAKFSHELRQEDKTLLAKVKVVEAGKNGTKELHITSVIGFSRSAPANLVQMHVLPANEATVRAAFGDSADLSEQRIIDFQQRLRQELQRLQEQRPNDPSMRLILQQFQLEAGSLVISRKEKNDGTDALATE
jgi:hypothetical protein